MINQKICQVWNCNDIAEYINPETKFCYCQKHYDNLNGKIIYQSANKNEGIAEISIKLIKIQSNFDIDKIEVI